MAGNNEFDLLKERIDHLKEMITESLKSVDQKHDRWQQTQDDDIEEQNVLIKEHKQQVDSALDNLNKYVVEQFKEVGDSISAVEKAVKAGDEKVVTELENSKREKSRYMITTALALLGLIGSIVFGILQL